MKVDAKTSNPNFCALLGNSALPLLLDANILIPPDRSSLSSRFRPVSYAGYLAHWLEPLALHFPGLCVHEAVRDEICKKEEKDALDGLILKHSIPLVSDSSLSKHPTNSSGCAGTTSREEWASVSKLGVKRQSLWVYCACKEFRMEGIASGKGAKAILSLGKGVEFKHIFFAILAGLTC